jgi:alpha-N-arabinofuranosidase
MVNVIAPIVTGPNGIFLQTIYHPLKLYRDQCLEISLDAFVESPGFNTRIFCETDTTGENVPIDRVPYLDVSATTNSEGSQLCLAVINRHKDEAMEVEIDLGGFQPKKKANTFEINGPDVGAKNSFEEPDNVGVEEKDIFGAASEFAYTFPAHSITLVQLARA